jgi:hypothetical protein
MRRTTALLLFTLGYALMALFAPAVAAAPALLAFCGASVVLLRQPRPRHEFDRLARERRRG